MKRSLIALLLFLFGNVAMGMAAKVKEPPQKIKVVTTLSVLSALTRDIGGERVIVSSLSKADEDPHFIKAKPTFKRLVGEADLFFQIGRSLELWAPQVISASGNAKLISGGGVINASDGVASLEVPKVLSRQQGDIHPQGNPHVWLSPTAALKMASNIRDALAKTDPAHKALYDKNFETFKDTLSKKFFGDELVKIAKNNDFLWRLQSGGKIKAYAASHKMQLGGWLKQAQAIDYPFFSYHSDSSYLAKDFDLNIVGQIEEKSGVPPTAKYQDELVKKALAQKITHIVSANYYVGQGKLINLIAQRIGGQRLFVAIDAEPGQSYFDFMDKLLGELVKFKSPPKK